MRLSLRSVQGRSAAAAVALSALLLLAGCAPGMPNSVVPDSSVSIGWTHTLTSTNAASASGATLGNFDIAAMTRGSFTQVTNTGLVADPSFGTVTVLGQEPFVVEYDLANVQWSDGVPIEVSDLLLAWAAGSNAQAADDIDPADFTDDDGSLDVPDDVAWFDSVDSQLDQSVEVPDVNESERSIEIQFEVPISTWRTALDIAVPAHVVGELAFDIDDPMVAKQRVMDAILSGDTDDLAAIAAAWNSGFAIGAAPDQALLLSSGPFVIDSVNGTGVDLTVNRNFLGERTPGYQDVSLVEIGPGTELDRVESNIDVVQVTPDDVAFENVHRLELNGYGSYLSSSGSMWSLALNVEAPLFGSVTARWAFLHSVPRAEMVGEGSGEWTYVSSNHLVTTPGTAAYELAELESGFAAAYTVSDDQIAAERASAGILPGTQVCVLYDKRSSFASAAFVELQVAMLEDGWDIVDCGTLDFDAALADRAWDAVIAEIPLSSTAAGLASTWGSEGAGNLSGSDDFELDALIQDFAESGTYIPASNSRDSTEAASEAALAAIEARLIQSAIAVPLALSPVVTITQPAVGGIEVRDGERAPLASNVVAWGPEED